MVFVRHGRPAITRGVPPRHWRLASSAAQDVRRLGRRLGDRRLVVSSEEPKAIRTAELLAPVEHWTDARCNEAGRPDHWDPRYAETVGNYLRTGDAQGWEPAAAVQRRVTQATRALPAGAIVVGHGIAMTLLVGALHPVDLVGFWRQLRMPDAWLVTPTRLLRL